METKGIRVSFVMTVVVTVPFSMKPDDELGTALTDTGPRGYSLSLLLDEYPLRVFGGVFNRVTDQEFMEWLSGLPWRWKGGWPMPREQVVVLTHHEYSESPALVHRLTKDAWESA